MPKVQKPRWPVAVGIAGALLVALLYLILGQLNSPRNRVLRAMELGERYLLEENYEQAIIQFTNAIEITQSEPSLLYLADQAQDRLDVAVRTGAAAQVQAEGGDLQDAVTWLDTVSCADEPSAQVFVNGLSLLERLRDLCAAQDYDAVFSLLADEAYKQTVAELMGLDCKVRLLEDSTMTAVYGMEVGTENFADGESLTVPGPSTSETARNDEETEENLQSVSTDYMVYYGGHDNGIRNGEAVWLAYRDGNNYLARGSWSDDVPNGEFETRSWQADLEQSVTYRVIRGTVKAGLWDGPVTWSFERSDQTDTYNPSFREGFWEVLRQEDGYAVVAENNPDDRLVAEEEDVGKTHGIAGYAQSA